MIKKYFIVSDVHSYYNVMVDALAKAGYNKDNPNHYLVFNGDIFDRGDGTLQLYNLVRNHKTNNVILIRGNHEQLMTECIERGEFFSHDWSNGTARSVCTIALGREFKDNLDIYNQKIDPWGCCQIAKEMGVVKWINSDNWLNYLEIGPYIITHSFIPLDVHGLIKPSRAFYDSVNYYSTPYPYFDYMDNWRTEATPRDWAGCTWGNPYTLYKQGWFAHEEENGKYLISGHWGTSDYWNNWDKHDAFQNEHFIGLDATTALSHQINVAIITEDTDTNSYSLELK